MVGKGLDYCTRRYIALSEFHAVGCNVAPLPRSHGLPLRRISVHFARMQGIMLVQLSISFTPSAAYVPVAPSIRSCSVAMVETESETQLDVLRESAPDGPGSAIGIMAELKANAALFSAFAFGSLNLPAPLLESTSKVVLSQGVTITTAKPVSDSALLQAFVLLDTATLCLMLVCVAASQLCIYRLADGSYGTIRFSTDDKVDRRDTALGRLVNQYRSEVLLPCSPASLLSPLPLSSRSTFALRPTHCLSSFGLRESRSRSG